MSTINISIPAHHPAASPLVVQVAGASGDPTRDRRTALEFLAAEGYVFEGRDFGAEWIGAFQDAILPGLVLKNCTGTGLNFTGSNLRGARFEDCVFRNVTAGPSTTAHGLVVIGTRFEECYLSGLNAPESSWHGSFLRRCTARELNVPRSKWASVRTTGTDLAGMKCEMADMSGLEGSETILSSADLTENQKAAVKTLGLTGSTQAAETYYAALQSQTAN